MNSNQTKPMKPGRLIDGCKFKEVGDAERVAIGRLKDALNGLPDGLSITIAELNGENHLVVWSRRTPADLPGSVHATVGVIPIRIP